MEQPQEPEMHEQVRKLRFSSETSHDQMQSYLFAKLPAELRDMVFHLALMDYEDLEQPYRLDTPYGRPGYRAPRRTDTALLRTCQRVYQEAWFRPWSGSLQTIWFTGNERRPPNSVTDGNKLERQLKIIADSQVDVEIDHVRIFAQLYKLEDGRNLKRLLRVQHFRPRCLTITLRHTDWWFWEHDEPLHISLAFMRECVFPDSVQEIRMELESLERRKGQIDSIVQQMKASTWFRRSDQRDLYAHNTLVSTEHRTGVSRWEGTRWVRDEVAPNQLSYYMATVVWRPLAMHEQPPLMNPLPYHIHAFNPPNRVSLLRDYITSEQEERYGIAYDMPADAAIALVAEREAREAQEAQEAQDQYDAVDDSQDIDDEDDEDDEDDDDDEWEEDEDDEDEDDDSDDEE